MECDAYELLRIDFYDYIRILMGNSFVTSFSWEDITFATPRIDRELRKSKYK